MGSSRWPRLFKRLRQENYASLQHRAAAISYRRNALTRKGKLVSVAAHQLSPAADH
jgi:hypothetical protein